MWRYDSRTGYLYSPINGRIVAVGYSGRGEGFNAPYAERVAGIGPIPVGRWAIGKAFHHRRLGRVAIPLVPVGHDAHGRSGFYIHGDNARMDHTASSGCIILDYHTRLRISTGPWMELEVFASPFPGEPVAAAVWPLRPSGEDASAAALEPAESERCEYGWFA